MDVNCQTGTWKLYIDFIINVTFSPLVNNIGCLCRIVKIYTVKIFSIILSARGKIMKNPLRDFGGTYLQCALKQVIRRNLPE